jgi:asparagine synthase (glutamine-hydrolysing)
MEMGLVAVVATQLWHHTFIDPTLASLPDWRSLARHEADNRGADFAESGAAAVA